MKTVTLMSYANDFENESTNGFNMISVASVLA